MEGNDFWDKAKYVDMGGTEDSTFSHVAKIIHGVHLEGEVLEIGCGMGRLLKPLSEAYPDVLFTGYDPSLSLLNKAPVLDNVIYTTTLPNHNKKFDYIFSMLVFQHIPDEAKQEYIEYAAKHLKKGATFRSQFVVGDYDGPNDHNSSLARMEVFMKKAKLNCEATKDQKHENWWWANARRKK